MQADSAIATAERAGTMMKGAIPFVPATLDKTRTPNLSKIGRQALVSAADPHIPPEDVTRILENARNMTAAQRWPWRWYVASDAQRQALRDTLIATMNNFMLAKRNKYERFNREWHASHRDRICEEDPIYQELEELEPDKRRLLNSYYRNIHLLHSPAFLFLTLESRLALSGWLEYGGFPARIMASAADYGLATESAGFTPFHHLIREVLQWPDTETPICGISMQPASAVVIADALRRR